MLVFRIVDELCAVRHHCSSLHILYSAAGLASMTATGKLLRGQRPQTVKLKHLTSHQMCCAEMTRADLQDWDLSIQGKPNTVNICHLCLFILVYDISVASAA